MSYFQGLLDTDRKLEPHEVQDLRQWLAVLKQDVALFGETGPDIRRINRVERKLYDQQIHGQSIKS